MANSKCRWQCPEDWDQWSQWLAAGLHARNRWRLPVLLVGILFAHGRRTVTTWLRAAGVSPDFQDYYYFLAALGGKTKSVASQLLLLVLRTLPLPDRLLAVIDDTPTKRYGPKVEGADIHRNPTPGPADQKYLYGHIWVTLSLAVRHPCFGALALPLRAMLYVRRQTMAKIPKWRDWTFATKLVLAARLVEWIAPIIKEAGKTLWIVVDGGYVKAPFLHAPCAGVTVVGRLRKDAALRDLSRRLRRGQRRGRGRPPKYGKHRISLAKRAAHREGWEVARCTIYGKTVTKLYKTFLATYRPTGGVIRVVIVLEDRDWYPFFSTDPFATAVEIIEAFADRATIEQDFHDVKEVWRGPAAGTKHLVQPGRLSFESLDAYAGGTLVLEPPPRQALRSPPVTCRSPQSLAATDHGTRIIDACRRPAAATENPPTDQASYDLGRVR